MLIPAHPYAPEVHVVVLYGTFRTSIIVGQKDGSNVRIHDRLPNLIDETPTEAHSGSCNTAKSHTVASGAVRSSCCISVTWPQLSCIYIYIYVYIAVKAWTNMHKVGEVHDIGIYAYQAISDRSTMCISLQDKA